MAGTTPIFGFPYPQPTDLVADYPALGQDLAEDIETLLNTNLRIRQVVSATHATEVSTTSTTYVTTNLSATITPATNTNKVLIITTVPAQKTTNSVFSGAYIGLFRGTVAGTLLTENIEYADGANSQSTIAHVYLDSPATTSATTYTVGLRTASNVVTVKSCPGGVRANLILCEVRA